MGRCITPIEWLSLTWRSAAKDERVLIRWNMRGMMPNSRTLYDYLNPRNKWCQTDECVGMWSSESFSFKEWDDEEQEDVIVGMTIVFRFTDPRSAMAFKLRWC
ncbi:MAG: hypothetical protein EOP84_14070 [Verrucomicrobiaceae bacterium]|nr:MAG: hypothetical protein EOP84_14070 [Verrucomicrobiaceae bacterium]